MVRPSKEVRQRVAAEMNERKERRRQLLQKRIDRQQRDLAAACEEAKGRIGAAFGVREHRKTVTLPVQPALYGRAMKVGPRIWGKTVSPAGVAQCSFHTNGKDVHVMRVRRKDRHYYAWLVVPTRGLPLAGSYVCGCEVHEARAFNDSFGEMIGVLFRIKPATLKKKAEG